MAERDLEGWEWRNPADVAERRELQLHAAKRKELDQHRKTMAERAERELLIERIFRKASRA